MNADQTIETCTALARQQYPDDAELRHAYHVGLLETKLREFAYRFRFPCVLEVPVLDEPPPTQSATVIDLASKTVLHD